MKALSIRQPWASLIVAGIKDIENRMWRTDYRGPILIHAARIFDETNIGRYEKLLRSQPILPMSCGGIIGQCVLTDCVTQSANPWFDGAYGFVLTDPRPLPFLPLRGQRGLFEVPQRLLATSPEKRGRTR